MCVCVCVQDVVEKQESVKNFQEMSITTATYQDLCMRDFLSGGAASLLNCDTNVLLLLENIFESLRTKFKEPEGIKP